MGNSYMPRRLSSPAYRPPRFDRASHSREVRKTIRDSGGSRTDGLLYEALARAGIVPEPFYGSNLGSGESSGWKTAGSIAAVAIMALAPFVVMDRTLTPAKAQENNYPTPEKILEDANSIRKIEISPSGDRLAYLSGGDLKEFKIDTGSKEFVESGSSSSSGDISVVQERFTFTEGGDLVYAVIASHDNGSQISGKIKEKSDGGIETLVSTSGNEALYLGGDIGGKLFYSKDIYDSNGNLKESAIFSKDGSATPIKVLSLSGSQGSKIDEVSVNKDGTKILFTETTFSGEPTKESLKSVNPDGTSLETIATSEGKGSSSHIDFSPSYGKVAFAHSIKKPSELVGTYDVRELVVADESGTSQTPLESDAASLVDYKDIEWMSRSRISYIDGESIMARGIISDSENPELLEDGATDHLWFGQKLFFVNQGSLYVVDYSKFNHQPELRVPTTDVGLWNSHFDAVVGRKLSARVMGYDADGDPLTFSASQPLLNVNPQTGEIEWTPTSKDLGMKAADVCVSDGKASECSQMRIKVALPTQRFALPFSDKFDEQQRQGQDGSDRWAVDGDSSHWPRIVGGRYSVDGSAAVGWDYLTDYLFSMEFLGSSLKPGKSFDLVFGRGLGSSGSPRVIKLERGLDGGLTIYPDYLEPIKYPNGTVVKQSVGTRLPDPLTNEKSYQVGLAVSRLRERVYFDGIQILRIDNERSPAGNIQIAGSGLLIDDVSITAWKNSPPTANLPASLALQKGKQTPFRFEASDPDGDPVTTEVETDGLANITKVSERDFRIKPLSRISAVQVRLSDGEGEANYSVRASVIAPATQQSWVGSLPLIGYLTAALLGSAGAVYVIRRLRKSSRPSGQIPEVAARPSAFGYPPPYFAHPGAQFADTRRPQPPPFQYAQPPFRQPGGSPPLRRGPRIVRDLNEKRE